MEGSSCKRFKLRSWSGSQSNMEWFTIQNGVLFKVELRKGLHVRAFVANHLYDDQCHKYHVRVTLV